MSFLQASTSFTRFRIVDPVPGELWPAITDLLRRFAFKDIDESPEEHSEGWVSFEDMLDTDFSLAPVEKGEYIVFSFRQDTRRIPPAVMKKHHALAVKNEELHNREQGKKFVSRERKKELKEQVALRLRMRFLPIPAYFHVVWNTSSGIVYFASVQPKMLDAFQNYFTRTFNLHLEQVTPYDLAASLLEETSELDTLEPTQFA